MCSQVVWTVCETDHLNKIILAKQTYNDLRPLSNHILHLTGQSMISWGSLLWLGRDPGAVAESAGDSGADS